MIKLLMAISFSLMSISIGVFMRYYLKKWVNGEDWLALTFSILCSLFAWLDWIYFTA